MGKKANCILISSAALILLVCAVIVIRAVGGFIGGGNVAGEIAKLKVKGEPVTIADITPPKIPDDENAAVVYAKAFKLLPLGEANPEFRGLSEFVDDKTRRGDPKEWASAQRMVTKYAKALDLAEQATAESTCRFPIEWEKGWEAETPHYKGLRKLASLAAARAMVGARAGQTEQALDSVQLGVKMADSIRSEPTLLSFLVRAAMLKTALRSLNAVVSRNDIAESQAAQLDTLLSRIDLVEDGVKALQGERVIAMYTIEHFTDQRRETASGSGTSTRPGLDSLEGSPARGILKTVFRRDEAFYIRRMSMYIDHGREPYRIVQGDKKLAFIREEDAPRFAVFSNVFLLPVGHVPRSRDEAIAAVSASRILLALRLYRQRTGSYPQTLSELGRKLPEDPFSGHGFVYKKQGQGCTLYSIGPNLKDDGGTTIKRTRRKVSEVPAGDILWRLDN